MTHWKSRAAWRLEQAGRERTWALVSARAEGISIRTLATAAGLSPSRVHQLVAAAGLDALDAALGELRAAGWPAPAIAEMIGGMLAGGMLADRATTGDLQAVAWLALCGLGLGLVLPTAVDAALGAVDDETSGVSSGILQALRSAGGVFGAAILGAIMNTIYRDPAQPSGIQPASVRARQCSHRRRRRHDRALAGAAPRRPRILPQRRVPSQRAADLGAGHYGKCTQTGNASLQLRSRHTMPGRHAG